MQSLCIFTKQIKKRKIMEKRIWFITGISSGIGKALAEYVISQGEFVVGTFRKQEQCNAFTTANEGKGLGILCDITNAQQIADCISTIKEKYSRIDVLVNNAGFGFAGAIEETSIEEAREIFEANFFGTLQLTQQVLPIMRAQKSGRIIQISSHGGFKAFHGFGIYNASKFAVEGFSEALSIETAPLGIKVTLVEPGPFRTGFADAAFRNAETVIADYDGTAGAFRNLMKNVNGKQEGDPNKAAKAIFDISIVENPPLRLPLGKIAVISLTTKLEAVTKNLNEFKDIAEGAVFES
jgi:short-subunit dehydrogenase